LSCEGPAELVDQKKKPDEEGRIQIKGMLSTQDKTALCQAVAVSVPPSCLKAMLRIAQAAGEVSKVVETVSDDIMSFAKLRQDNCKGNTVLVYYSTVKLAFEAVWKLHRQVVGKGAKKTELWARQVNGEGANVRFEISAKN
jgi:hypothetical protein